MFLAVTVVVVLPDLLSFFSFCSFHGLKVPVPRNVRETLVGCYDESALTRCETNYYDHRQELYWEAANATVDCRHLEEALNMRQPEHMRREEEEEEAGATTTVRVNSSTKGRGKRRRKESTTVERRGTRRRRRRRRRTPSTLRRKRRPTKAA